jgi:hypothetical protein
MNKEELQDFHNQLWNLRHALLQFLHEPQKNIEKAKKEALSIKDFIEDLVVTEYKEREG